MSAKLIMSIITITCALIFYTVGVFSERKSKSLKLSHVIIFWCGLIFDTTGTSIMSSIAKESISIGFSLHGITGALAIILMLFHAVWATVVLCKKDKHKQETFHKFSIVVWCIWLVPYILGMIIGMNN